MRVLPCFLLLILSFVPLAPKAEVLLSVNDIQVTEDDLYHYLKEFLLPRAYESGLRKQDAIKNALVNLYVVRRGASVAISEKLVTVEEVAYRQEDGGTGLLWPLLSQTARARRSRPQTGKRLPMSDT